MAEGDVTAHPINNGLLTEIPAEDEVTAYQITSVGGTCKRGCMGEHFANLRRHFQLVHPGGIPKRSMVDIIPPDGDIAPENVTTRLGVCLWGCNEELTMLRRHLETFHAHPINNGLLTEIPAEDEVTAYQITSVGGTCNRGCMGEHFANLRRHFQLVHPGGIPKRSMVDIIPPDGDIAPENVTTQLGVCLWGCNVEHTNLKRHLETFHLDYWTTLLYSIPHDSNVFADELAASDGFCFIPGCEKKVCDLNEHFRTFHLGETWTCPRCGEKVKNYPSNRRGHFESHSGPAMCLVPNCTTEATSERAIKAHLSRNHTDVPRSTWRLLTVEEVAEFRIRAAASAARTAIRWIGQFKINDHRVLMKAYSVAVRDSTGTSQMYLAAARLKAEFEKYISVPEGATMAYNAAYVSHWNSDWRVPNVVMEVLEKSTQRRNYSSNLFFPDSQVPEDAQPTYNDDYSRSGYDRTHCASAAHFNDKVLAACTYQYTNVLPATPVLNRDILALQERKMIELADVHGRVISFRFPLFSDLSNPTFTKAGSLVRVPESIATVVIVEHQNGNGTTIQAWETHQTDDVYDYRLCGKEPFFLFRRAGINFNMQPVDFAEISVDMV